MVAYSLASRWPAGVGLAQAARAGRTARRTNEPLHLAKLADFFLDTHGCGRGVGVDGGCEGSRGRAAIDSQNFSEEPTPQTPSKAALVSSRATRSHSTQGQSRTSHVARRPVVALTAAGSTRRQRPCRQPRA